MTTAKDTQKSDSYHGKMKMVELCMALNGYGRMHWVVRLLDYTRFAQFDLGVTKGVEGVFCALQCIVCLRAHWGGDEA